MMRMPRSVNAASRSGRASRSVTMTSISSVSVEWAIWGTARRVRNGCSGDPSAADEPGAGEPRAAGERGGRAAGRRERGLGGDDADAAFGECGEQVRAGVAVGDDDVDLVG